MTPTEAPLRRALSTMAEQVEVVDLAGRVDAQLRHRRRRARAAALLAVACVASIASGVLLQTRDDERALPAQPGPVVRLDNVGLGNPESARLVVSGYDVGGWALGPDGHWVRLTSYGVMGPCRTLSADGRTAATVRPSADRVRHGPTPNDASRTQCPSLFSAQPPMS